MEGLKTGLYGLSDAITEGNSQANYEKLKQDAEQWKQEQAYKVIQANYMASQANLMDSRGQMEYLKSGFQPYQEQAPIAPPNAAMSMVGGGMGDASGNPIATPQAPKPMGTVINTPYGKMIGDPNMQETPQMRRLKNNDYFNKSDKLKDDFDRLSKDFRSTRDSYARIEASAKNPSAAGDLALIFNYMKTLDPGSTVREGEFATAQNSASIPDRIRGTYNKILQGTRLAPEQRKDFVDRARKLYESQASIQEKNISLYKTRAERFGLDPQDVITDLYDPETGGLSSLDIKTGSSSDYEGTKQFVVDGIEYNIPESKVSAFKKAKGIK